MDSTLLHDYIAGAVGGAAGLIVGHPFDTTKVQLQTQQTSTAYRGTWDAICNIHKHGWIKGFFRGMGFPLASYGVINSVFFGVYGNTLRYLNPDGKSTYTQVCLAGCVGGAAQLIVACPVDRVKVVLQSQIPHKTTTGTISGSYQGGTTRSMYFRGPIQCICNLYQSGGIRACYTGLSIMALRDLPASMCYFLIYEYLHSLLLRRGFTDHRGMFASLFAGGMAGVLSWLMIMPMDVMKSLTQADLTQRQYSGMRDCAVQVYRSGGVPAFFRGAVITSLRAFPVNGVIFLVHDQVMKLLDKLYSQNK